VLKVRRALCCTAGLLHCAVVPLLAVPPSCRHIAGARGCQPACLHLHTHPTVQHYGVVRDHAAGPYRADQAPTQQVAQYPGPQFMAA
jgi:hypothetical protein